MKSLFSILFLALLALSACQKELDAPQEQPPDELVCRPDSISIDGNGSKLLYNGDKFTGYFAADYSLQMGYSADSRPSFREYLYDNGATDRIEWEYNAAGFIVGVKKISNSGTGDTEEERYDLTYADNKPAVSDMYYIPFAATDYVFDGKYYYHWTGDNLSYTETYGANNLPRSRTDYTYDINRLNSFVKYPEFSLAFMGTPDGENLWDALFLSKNIMTKAVEPVDDRDYEFLYEYNSQNLISKITVVDKTINEPAQVIEYYYSCK